MEQAKVKSDAYFLITVTWASGFTHMVPCRGYNLGSQIKFHRSLSGVEKFTYAECDQVEYDRRVFGTGEEEWESEQVVDTKSKSSKISGTSRPSTGTARRKVTSKPSSTKASVKPAKKTTKSTEKSSTPKKKK